MTSILGTDVSAAAITTATAIVVVIYFVGLVVTFLSLAKKIVEETYNPFKRLAGVLLSLIAAVIWPVAAVAAVTWMDR